MTILIFAAILLLLVFVHELGHFITAKRAGVKVEEFGFGYPPRLFAVRYGETEYSLNLLPLGGFVRMLGEEDPTDPRSLAAQSKRTRVIVMAAGSLMNFALAMVLFSAGFMVPRETVVGPVLVQRVLPDSPAERAGFRPGDRILRINDRTIQNIADVHLSIQINLGSEMSVAVQRDRFTQEELRVSPRWNPPPGQGETGIVIGMPQIYTQEVSYPLWEAVGLGFRQSFDILSLAKNGLISMIIRGFSSQAVAGPIGIYQATEEVAQTGFGNILNWAAFLSMNLAVLNILPIPMLDGGRIAFVALEAIRRGQRISPRRETLVHFVGFMLLLALIIVISYFDVVRLIRGENLIR